MASRIIQHEDWQRVSLPRFINLHLVKGGLPPAPSIEENQGEVNAIINQGRWLVECPTPDCGGALIVSEQTPFFFCPYCANESNGGKWCKVAFPPPAQKREIEALLLKRPARRDFEAFHRNWRPGETLTQLRAENKMAGID